MPSVGCPYGSGSECGLYRNSNGYPQYETAVKVLTDGAAAAFNSHNTAHDLSIYTLR